MGDTDIDWADKVWNPVTGCTKISEGCRNCYSERMHKRLEKIKNSGYCDESPHFSIRLHPERLDEPMKWKKPQRIFVCSMGDWMHDDIPEKFIYKIIETIILCPQHTFLTLTKRPENFIKKLKGAFWKNLYLGVTVENQQAADERIPLLLQIPAAKRFISIEPMVGPVDLSRAWWGKEGDPSYPWLGRNANEWLHWVILGGETGPKARPIHPDWVRSVRDQCQATGVPFFFKQWGTYKGPNDWTIPAGHLLDGREYREWPKVLSE